MIGSMCSPSGFRTHRRTRVPLRLVVSLAALAATFAPALSFAAIVADSASDVCPPAADPCVVDQEVDVVDGSILDFGTRTVRVEGVGFFESGSGTAAISCGRFEANVAGNAIRSRETLAAGTSGGVVTIAALRRCSADNARTCLRHIDCSAFGAGSCSVGDGSIVLDGRILGSADLAARVTLRGAGDVSVLDTATVAGTSTFSDGGGLTVESGEGSVTIAAALDLTSGGDGTGGDLTLLAGLDIVVNAVIRATGGDFDGGSVTMDAGRDITITEDVLANSTSGSGFGGEIDVSAGRDLAIVGGGSANRLNLNTDGHQSADNFAGDGGLQGYAAERHLSVSRYVRFDSNGSPPDGFGDSISFAAGGDFFFEGIAVSGTKGGLGGGGFVEVQAEGDAEFTSTSLLDARGSGGGGGDIVLDVGGALVFAGSAEAGGGNGGLAGRVLATVGADADLSGDWNTAGSGSSFSVGEFLVEACRVRVSGNLLNAATGGRNRFVGREHIRILGGGSLRATGSGGTNAFRHRSAAKPPVNLGTVSPAATITVDASLVGCPVCGNAEVDDTETCDDGNLGGGDGCSTLCQDEGCESATPGYPSVPLCSDGSECTDDSCNTATHACTHTSNGCTDGIDCTADSCVAGDCVHETRHALCADSNECTSDLCSDSVGCLHAPLAAACDDGSFCNGADTCSNGDCSVHAGDPCSGGGECADHCDEASDTCAVAAGTPCTDDGNACSDDACDGLGTCAHPANDAACDDGEFCNGADHCRDGTCSGHAGDPCASGGECADACDEGSEACLEAAATPCGDDGNDCTDDVCDGLGSCTHPPAAGTCDDLDFCSSDDTCVAGECVATPSPLLRVGTLKVDIRGGGTDDGATWKGVFPSSTLSVSPASVNVRLVFTDLFGLPVYDATLPAGSFVGGGASFRFKAPTAAGVEGIFKASLKRVDAAGLVKARFKIARADLSAASGQETLALSLLFGDEPGGVPCMSSRELECTGGVSRLSCTMP